MSRLHDAISKNRLGACQKLLEHENADVNYHTDSLPPPLFTAVEKSKTKICEILLKKGAKPDFIYKGKTPLFDAAGKGSLRKC